MARIFCLNCTRSVASAWFPLVTLLEVVASLASQSFSFSPSSTCICTMRAISASCTSTGIAWISLIGGGLDEAGGETPVSAVGANSCGIALSVGASARAGGSALLACFACMENLKGCSGAAADCAVTGVWIGRLNRSCGLAAAIWVAADGCICGSGCESGWGAGGVCACGT